VSNAGEFSRMTYRHLHRCPVCQITFDCYDNKCEESSDYECDECYKCFDRLVQYRGDLDRGV